MPDDGKWLTLADVPPGSWVGRQIQLMRCFLAGELDPEEFVRQWYAARAQEMAYGERPGARIGAAMNDLHEALHDYDPSPTDREPEWIDESQLRDATRNALTRIENLRVGGRGSSRSRGDPRP